MIFRSRRMIEMGQKELEKLKQLEQEERLTVTKQLCKIGLESLVSKIKQQTKSADLNGEYCKRRLREIG